MRSTCRYITSLRHLANKSSAIRARYFSDNVTKDFSIQGLAKPGLPVYLDFQATTPMDPRVLDAMVIFCISKYI